MIDTIKNAWRIGDLRKKILYTLFIIVLFRVGSVIPVPFLNPDALKAFLDGSASNTIFGYINMMTGGLFSQATLFALTITPYINASIIMQLLTIAIPSLERMQKEGEDGRKKIAQITRYATIALSLVLSFGYYATLNSEGAVVYTGVFPAIVIMATFTAGSALVMWLGEQINENGIGNGISMILFASIISRGSGLVQSVITNIRAGSFNWITGPLFAVLAIVVVCFVVFMDTAERRIPVQYAKRQVGRRMYGGQSTHIPLKIAMTGVLPIIFAGSILSLPSTIAMFFPTPAKGSFWYHFLRVFDPSVSWIYAVLYFLMIIAFNYFYVAAQYNPIEMANNMKKNGGFIPGIRPGRPTSEYISRILSKLTFIGAIFLGIIATLPILISTVFRVNISLGGTTLLIVVGVALETTRQLESQMLIRHYKGFLE